MTQLGRMTYYVIEVGASGGRRTDGATHSCGSLRPADASTEAGRLGTEEGLFGSRGGGTHPLIYPGARLESLA